MWSSYSKPSLSRNDRQLNVFKIPSSCANTYHLSSPNSWGNMYLRTTGRSTSSRLLACPSQIVAPSVALCLTLATSWAMGIQGPSFPSAALPHSLLLEIVEVFCRDHLRAGVTGVSISWPSWLIGGEQVIELSGTPSL